MNGTHIRWLALYLDKYIDINKNNVRNHNIWDQLREQKKINMKDCR